MILALDTSSALSAVALVDRGRVVREQLQPSGRTFDLPACARAVIGDAPVDGVAVATGPGSFTGLRVGASFGLGLAVGLQVPMFTLGTLQVQAARASAPVRAVAEAGRGRIYHRADGAAAIDESAAVPADLGIVGWLGERTRREMLALGFVFVEEDRLATFGEAVVHLLESAAEVPYGSLRLEYIHTVAAGR